MLLRAFRYIFKLPASDRYYAPLSLPHSEHLEERARHVRSARIIHPMRAQHCLLSLCTSFRHQSAHTSESTT